VIKGLLKGWVIGTGAWTSYHTLYLDLEETDMQKLLLITGRLTGPKSVELDEAVTDMSSDVEVLVRPATKIVPSEKVSDFLRALPAGGRSKEDIDHQMLEERDSWGNR
jgi:hypothetical protein